MILFKIILVCRLTLPTSPGDATVTGYCQTIITPEPIEQSTGQFVIDYLMPVKTNKEGGNI